MNIFLLSRGFGKKKSEKYFLLFFVCVVFFFSSFLFLEIMDNFIKALHWRYATKHMTGKKVPDNKVEQILEAIRLSASSYGLQPYKIFVITDPKMREKISPVAYHQPQIIECSHLLVFAVLDSVTEEYVKNFIHHMANVRSVAPETFDSFQKNLLGFVTSKSTEELFQWTSKQVYIALGTGLAAAALAEVDSTPMEGFNPAELDKILKLKEKGFRSVVLLPLGYRDDKNDSLVNAKKVRWDRKEFVEYLT